MFNKTLFADVSNERIELSVSLFSYKEYIQSINRTYLLSDSIPRFRNQPPAWQGVFKHEKLYNNTRLFLDQAISTLKCHKKFSLQKLHNPLLVVCYTVWQDYNIISPIPSLTFLVGGRSLVRAVFVLTLRG